VINEKRIIEVSKCNLCNLKQNKPIYKHPVICTILTIVIYLNSKGLQESRAVIFRKFKKAKGHAKPDLTEQFFRFLQAFAYKKNCNLDPSWICIPNKKQK